MKKHSTIIIIMLLVYILVGLFKPIGDDEAFYVNAGKGIIQGEYDFNNFHFSKEWSPPFTYIMGSPISPLIYGASYMLGGMALVRIVVSLAAALCIYLLFMTMKKRKVTEDSAIAIIIVVGLGMSTLMIATEAFLDVFALLFMMAGIYLYDSEKMMFAGIFFGLAASAKYILILPLILVGTYSVFKKHKGYMLIIGGSIITCIYLLAFWEMVPYISEFILNSKLGITSPANNFLRQIVLGLPLISILLIAYVIGYFKKLKWDYLWIIFASLWIYHIATLDSNALVRHLPYMEFSGAVLLSIHFSGKINPEKNPVKNPLKKLKKEHYIAGFIFGLVTISWTCSSFLYSFEKMPDEVLSHKGPILTYTANKYALMSGAGVNYSSFNISTFDLYDRDGINGSQIEDFEVSINEEYFEKIFIPAFDIGYTKYDRIRNLTIENYCPAYAEKESFIEAYARCK